MAIISQNRVWNGIQVREDINNETGAIFVYAALPPLALGLPFGTDALLFRSDGNGNDWVVQNDEVVKRLYNSANGTNSTAQDIERAFLLEGRKVFDNDRAYVLNSPGSYDDQAAGLAARQSFFDKGVPRVVNPNTQQQVNSEGDKTTEQVEPNITQRTTDTENRVGDDTANTGAGADSKESETKTTDTDDPVTDSKDSTTPKGDELYQYEVGTLRYPLANLDVTKDLGISYDYIKITVLDFVSSLISNQQTGAIDLRPSGAVERYSQSKEIRGTIILPMVQGISASNAISWGGSNINVFERIIASSLATTFTKQINDNSTSSIMNAVKEGVKTFGAMSLDQINQAVKNKQGIAAMLAGYVMGNSQIGTRASGQVINPNMELLFGGPSLRTFGFTFQFAPRFGLEAEMVGQIVKAFKAFSAPKIQETGSAFLGTPNIFQLEYIYNGEDGAGVHPYLNKFKPCALTNLKVDYTPEGPYMTYRGEGGKGEGSMVYTTLTLQFTELEPIYDIDYKDSHLVGF